MNVAWEFVILRTKNEIAIARALYKEAKFIVFDEPTSALDKNTERDFIYYLNSLPSDITLFIISHREIFSVCDRVFNLNNQKTLFNYE